MKDITVVNRAPGVTHEAKWCAGFTDEECDEHCQLNGFGKYTCNPKYVNLLTTNKRQYVTDKRLYFTATAFV